MRKTGRKPKDAAVETSNGVDDPEGDHVVAENGGDKAGDSDANVGESTATNGKARKSVITKPLVAYDADDSDDSSVKEGDDDDDDDFEVEKKGKKVATKRAAPASKKGREKRKKVAAKVNDEDEESDGDGKKGKEKRKKGAVKEDKEFEVDKVVDVRDEGGVREFKIRWKGFRPSDDTWEAEPSLSCPEAIKAYLDSQPAPAKSKAKPKKKDIKGKGKGKKPAAKKPAKVDDEDGSETDGKEYEVDRVLDVYNKKNGKHEFLIRWKGFKPTEDTWEPEEHLNCPDLISKFMAKVEKAKTVTERELRVSPQHTDRYTLMSGGGGRRLSRRGGGKQRATYHDFE